MSVRKTSVVIRYAVEYSFSLMLHYSRRFINNDNRYNALSSPFFSTYSLLATRGHGQQHIQQLYAKIINGKREREREREREGQRERESE